MEREVIIHAETELPYFSKIHTTCNIFCSDATICSWNEEEGDRKNV